MFLSALRTLGAKIEGTPYTAETLTGADYDFRAYNIKYSPDLEEIKRKYATGDFSSFTSVIGKQRCKISFDIDLAWSGTANVAPEWGKLLQGCGYEAVAYTTTGIGYIPRSTKNAIPLTLEAVDRNEGASPVQVVIKLSGAMGNVKFSGDGVGKPIKASFEFDGSLASITDRAYASIIVPSGFDTTNPDGVLSASITGFGYTLDVDKIEIDTGNKIGVAGDPAKATGIRGGYVVDRENTTMKIDPSLDTISNKSLYAKWAGCTTGTFTMTIGSHLTIYAPCAQIVKGFDGADRDGFVVNTLECILTRTDADTEDCLEILQGARA